MEQFIYDNKKKLFATLSVVGIVGAITYIIKGNEVKDPTVKKLIEQNAVLIKSLQEKDELIAFLKDKMQGMDEDMKNLKEENKALKEQVKEANLSNGNKVMSPNISASDSKVIRNDNTT